METMNGVYRDNEGDYWFVHPDQEWGFPFRNCILEYDINFDGWADEETDRSNLRSDYTLTYILPLQYLEGDDT